ncbi:hypothetical protein [Sphingomonas spermidinifaciens]|uniref:hypothetical protein n=1 Tax=Sphingomonas spermidinifaciens TaxID=1141889 RepID=UPI001142A44A|nr:hypothetical protein [Sphingomonas spermidinifaciens]
MTHAIFVSCNSGSEGIVPAGNPKRGRAPGPVSRLVARGPASATGEEAPGPDARAGPEQREQAVQEKGQFDQCRIGDKGGENGEAE